MQIRGMETRVDLCATSNSHSIMKTLFEHKGPWGTEIRLNCCIFVSEQWFHVADHGTTFEIR